MIKRGQEEVVGFVAIIVIVAIALVFFIGISLRDRQPEAMESVEIQQFLDSTAQFTTLCDIGVRQKYANLQQLLETCHKNPESVCLEGGSVCEIYQETITKLLETSWPIREGGSVKGYAFNATYSSQTGQEEIISFHNGSCTGSFASEERLSPDVLAGGTFVTSLQICY